MVLTALIMGFAGSLHCIGMCSPLAMAVTNMSRSVLVNRIVYNSGRVLTYGILGAVVASLGLLISLTKYQYLISIALGMMLIAIGFGELRNLSIPYISSPFVKFNTSLKKTFERFLKSKSTFSIFILGALNGLLPCGLTFLALSFCVSLKGPFDGFQFMLLFGAGTLPAMLGVTSIFQFLSRKLRISIKSFATGMMILSGMLLIARVFVVHMPISSPQQFVDIMLCR